MKQFKNIFWKSVMVITGAIMAIPFIFWWLAANRIEDDV